MRARFVYEKFEEDSDPIRDMNIGIKGMIPELEKRYQNIVKNIKSKYSYLLSSEQIPFAVDILNFITSHKDHTLHDRVGWVNLYHEFPNFSSKDLLKVKDIIQKHEKLLFGKVMSESTKLSEKFQEDSDPIKDLGIGTRELIKKDLDTIKGGDAFTVYDKIYKQYCADKDDKYLMPIVRVVVQTILKLYHSSYYSLDNVETVYKKVLNSEFKFRTQYLTETSKQRTNVCAKKILKERYGLVLK